MSPTISIKSASISEPIRKFSTIPDQDPVISKPRRNTTIGHNLSAVSSPIASTSTKKTKVKNYSEYLDFESPIYHNQVFDSSQSPTQIGLTAHLSGQFSLSPITQVNASDDCSNNNNCTSSLFSKSSPAQDLLIDNDLELTFYRRNLFQVSSIVSNISSAVYSVSPSTGKKSRIVTMAMEISISGTDETKTPKLLYIPTKPDSTKSTPEQANVELEPKVKILGDQTHGCIQASIVHWKRLQFRYATTHNGRRRLQNYFNLGVTLFAELATRERVPVVQVVSKPIVVRGRNPQFYKNRKTIHITDSTVQTNEFAPWRETVEGKRRSSEVLDHSIAVKPEENVELEAPERVKRAKIRKSRPDTIKSENKIDSDKSSNKSESEIVTEENDESKHSDTKICQYEYVAMPSNYLTGPVDYFYRPHSMVHLQTLNEDTRPMKRTFATASY